VSVSNIDLAALANKAWDVRQNAHLIGKTAVGCAALGENGVVYVGCNVEHVFRSHDVHAEVNAITSMVAAGCKKVLAVVIAAERERFTPCGACMDWVMQFGGTNCVVAFQARRGGPVQEYTAHDLMPHYPL
jgi:cytidine deaminase